MIIESNYLEFHLSRHKRGQAEVNREKLKYNFCDDFVVDPFNNTMSKSSQMKSRNCSMCISNI